MSDSISERAKQFVVKAFVSALIGVELCLLAAEKASSGAVRDLAVTALDAHCEIANAIADTALRHDIAIPTDFDEDHKELMHLLIANHGGEFDRAFVEALIKENEAAFFFHAAETIQGAGADTEGVAALALPKLEEQLSLLRSILSCHKPS